MVMWEFNWLPPFITEATTNIVNKLKEQHPDGLKEVVMEIKSCSSFMFENYERKQVPSPHHKMQLFHYLKASNMTEGHIVYICKDDARLLEFGVINPSSVEDDYRADIERLSGYFAAGERPPKESPIVFDEDFGKFSANWKVAYSNYLTLIYGLENQHAFDAVNKPMVERWNRVMGRVKSGAKMTDKNLAVLDEISGAGFDVEYIKEKINEETEETKE